MSKTQALPVVSAASTEALLGELERLKNSALKLEKEIGDRAQNIAQLQDEQEEAQKSARSIRCRSIEIQNVLFVRQRPETKFIIARDAYIKKMQHAKSDKITVAKQKILREQLTKELHTLQSTCAHEFIFSYDGYGGSRSNDFDDAHRGERKCMLCQLSEMSEHCEEDVYNGKLNNMGRLIRRDLRRAQDLPTYAEYEWLSIDSLKSLFEESARSINLVWPKTPIVVVKGSRL